MLPWVALSYRCAELALRQYGTPGRVGAMSNWRTNVPTDVQTDLDECFGAATNLALQLKAKNGEFFPIAATVDHDGAANYLGVIDEELGDQPASLDVLDYLYRAASASRDSFRAVAFGADVALADGQDAVRIEVEHLHGTALQVLVPYTMSVDELTPAMADMVVSKIPGRIWPTL